jgi:hypothetical protein
MRRRELVLSVLLRPLVASHSRPGGNLTGVSRINVQVGATWLALLHEMVPDATLMRPLAQELINPAVEVPTDEFGDDVGHNSAARKSRFTQQRMVAILRKDREPVLASGPGRTVCAGSKGFRVSNERGAVSSATRNPMQHTVRRRAGPQYHVGRARPVAPLPARGSKV